MTRRHPLEVTVDRLEDHHVRYYDQLEPYELDAINLVNRAFERVIDQEADAQ